MSIAVMSNSGSDAMICNPAIISQPKIREGQLNSEISLVFTRRSWWNFYDRMTLTRSC
jgi:hypothetical protein